MSDQKIEKLINSLREVLQSGKTVDVIETPFINFIGDIDSKGLIWSGQGYNKQFVFSENPDRFFVSENLDLAKDKSLLINGVNLLSETELGASITKSNLRQVGRLRGLDVDGSISVNQYLIYDANTDRLGLGTDQPKASFNILDMNVDLVFGASEPNIGAIGTFNSAQLELITDNTARITVDTNGDIVLGNYNFGPIKVSVVGAMGINVNNIDSRADLHVNGPIKFNNKLHISGLSAPSEGIFNEGDICWNVSPKTGQYIGWVCVKSGPPGEWKGFGKIE